ncbi:MAG: hypothetical protein AAGO57_05100 [Pseudomonadota bacterium]
MFPFQWSPTVNFPLSGDVTQDIDPMFGVEIKGIVEIERTVLTDVASYGKQLGKVLEALLILADDPKKLPEIKQLVDDIEEVKRDAKDTMQKRAKDALDRLKEIDPEGHAAFIATYSRGS